MSVLEINLVGLREIVATTLRCNAGKRQYSKRLESQSDLDEAVDIALRHIGYEYFERGVSQNQVIDRVERAIDVALLPEWGWAIPFGTGFPPRTSHDRWVECS